MLENRAHFGKQKEVKLEKPRRVNSDIHVVTTYLPAGQLGVLPVNWYLIKAKEPVLVDTGMPIEREQFLETLRSLIDPVDIKWIFLTHDDNDHAGNLGQVMEAAPNARVVTPFVGFARLADSHVLPIDRMLLINPGQSFSAGDRELGVMRAPIWDSPATHTLYDPKSEVLFAADSLGALIPGPAEDVTDVSEAAYAEGFHTFARALSPWVHLVDQSKFDGHLETFRKLEAKTILSSHGPVAYGRADHLLRALSTVPTMEPFVGPDHEQMVAMMAMVEAGGQMN
jgi:flavorubredoxin